MLIPIMTSFNSKGVKAAEKSFGELLYKSLKTKLAIGTVGTALYKFGKDTVQAAIAEDAALSQLNQTLRASGFAGSTQAVAKWIDQAELATGWTDDELRPALGLLVRTTNDLTVAQGLLATSQSIAAGTGKDLTTVSSAIAKAFAGQRKGLQQLGTGLDSTFLKAAPLADVLKAMNKEFAGAQAARLDTYAVKVARLNNAITQGKEKVGQTIIDTFLKSVGDGRMEQAMQRIAATATAVSETIVGFGIILKPVIDPLMRFVDSLDNSKVVTYFSNVNQIQSLMAASMKFHNQQMADERTALAIKRAQEAAAAKEAKAKAAAAAAAAKELAAKKLAYKFDLNAINIQAALTKSKSVNTTDRLNALSLIAQNQAGLAVSSSAVNAANAAMTNVTVNVAGTVTSEGQLVQTLQESLRIAQQRNGYGKWGGGL